MSEELLLKGILGHGEAFARGLHGCHGRFGAVLLLRSAGLLADIGEVLGLDVALHAIGAHLAPLIIILDDVHKAAAGNAVAAAGVIRRLGAHLQRHGTLGNVGDRRLLLLGQRRKIHAGQKHHNGHEQHGQTMVLTHSHVRSFLRPFLRMGIHILLYYTCSGGGSSTGRGIEKGTLCSVPPEKE